jgi:hypothetical protein
MLNPSVHVLGLAFWTPRWPDWSHASAALKSPLASLPVNATAPSARPSPPLLGPNERRRAPDSVLMALQVAHDACVAAELEPAHLPSVFCSAHGDLVIVDTLCRTLAQDPLLLSPLRFHHSVHNAASGYWAIACRSLAASTAVAAGPHTFAAGWLEAASQCVADDTPVLLVGCDTAAVGPLESVNQSRGWLAVAMVLSPRAAPPGPARIDWQLQAGATSAPGLRHRAWRDLRSNALADALPLFEALADKSSTRLALPLSETLSLSLHIHAP